MKPNQILIAERLNILIVDDVHEILTIGLRKIGHQVLYLPDASREDIFNTIVDMHVLVIRTKTQVDKGLIDKAPNLKCIARAGAGLDNIDVEYADFRNICCLNAGEANADAVGEHTLGMLLMLLNKLAIADREVRMRVWKREANRGLELAGKTVGIIGFGNTGKAVAAKLKGFNVRVLAYDKYLADYSNENAEESSLNQIFETADIISFHVPLTIETNQWVDANFICRFTKNIFLLNLSRGKVLKTSDLVQEMKNGKVLGAALDVLENENVLNLNPQQERDFKYLTESEKVVLSPHIGGWTVESYRKISQILLDKLLTFRVSS